MNRRCAGQASEELTPLPAVLLAPSATICAEALSVNETTAPASADANIKTFMNLIVVLTLSFEEMLDRRN
jgi:hypothetical protein